MIVICGIPSEPPVRLLIDAAASIGAETLILNQRDAGRTDLEFVVDGPDRRALYHCPQGAVDIATASGAFVRMTDFRELPEYQQSGSTIERWRIEAWHAMLCDWLETSDYPVMNRIKPGNSNMSKPFQAQLIARTGLRTPATLVTNQPSEVLAFRKQHGRIIYKSISANRSIVRELTPEQLTRIERIRTLPTQFQALIAGEDVRVHVVADKVFATLIVSDAVDYRYAADQHSTASYEAVTLPESVAEKCRLLARKLELPLCGIDFKRTPDGEYYCLEANPAPAYSCFEEKTGQPIAMAIARHLADGAI